jgi:hypothetical protein
MRTRKNLDLAHPLQARKWLRNWVDDPITGIRLRPNLELPREVAGFSFNSNALGLRGPLRLSAPCVILGTSFAMGIAVDNGENWWEQLAQPEDWLNLALPVGLFEMRRLIQEVYEGSFERVLFVYHPNVLQQCLNFERLRSQTGKAFQILRWETRLLPCLLLALKRRLRRRMLAANGEFLIARTPSAEYPLDARYCRIRPGDHSNVLNFAVSTLGTILGQFRDVILLRARIKQELLPKQSLPQAFQQLHKIYDETWDCFTVPLKALLGDRLTILDSPESRLEHFHSLDTHWNASGNAYVANLLNASLS